MKRIGRYCYERVSCSKKKRPTKKWPAKKRAGKRAKKRPAKKRAKKKRAASAGTTVPGAAVIPRRRGTTEPRPLSRSEFARAVERGAIEAPPWHPNSDKSLIHDVYMAGVASKNAAGVSSLRGLSFDDFKARLRAERFPMDRIDLVEMLAPEQRVQNDFFGLGPYAIRKRVRLA